MTRNHHQPEPVGGKEVAGRLGVRRETVAQWKQRGLLPPPRWTVSGEDAWDWVLDIEPWARATGRLAAEDSRGGDVMAGDARLTAGRPERKAAP